ncbi:hypothetical protein B0H19DRAFT_95632 [Mycena capillaripes]|nr:hypothetical protein B0H19DRAFT_95632 [Mycena capillaripes]
MCRFCKGTLVTAVLLGFCAPGVWPLTITGPVPSAHPNGTVTFTWTKDPTDPALIEIDVDEALNSLLSTDGYWIAPNITTADGTATIGLNDLSVGTHLVAFSSNDGFQVLAKGSLEIVAIGSSLSVPASTSSAPPSSSSSPPSSSSSPPTSSSSSQSSSSSSPSQTSPPNPVPKHTNVGAIAGGVVGGLVVIVLALLAWWYLRRRRTSSAYAAPDQASPGEITQFLAPPVAVGSALGGASAAHNRSRSDDEFRPWEENDAQTRAGSSVYVPTQASSSAYVPTQAGSSAGTSAFSPNAAQTFSSTSARTPALSLVGTTAPSDSGSSSRGIPAPVPVPNRGPPRDRDPQPEPTVGPSREELLQEVQRLREQIDDAPPEYPGPG